MGGRASIVGFNYANQFMQTKAAPALLKGVFRGTVTQQQLWWYHAAIPLRIARPPVVTDEAILTKYKAGTSRMLTLLPFPKLSVNPYLIWGGL